MAQLLLLALSPSASCAMMNDNSAKSTEREVKSFKLNANFDLAKHGLSDFGKVYTPLDKDGNEIDVRPQSEHVEDEGPSTWTRHIKRQHIEPLHRLMDADRDGKVSMAEILKLHKEVVHQEARKWSEKYWIYNDDDKDGKLTLSEYLGKRGQLEDDTETHKIQRARETETFYLADQNGDGHLDEHEIPAVSHPSPNADVMELNARHHFSDLDVDKDGQLTRDEFSTKRRAAMDFIVGAYDVDLGDTHDEFLMKEFKEVDADGSGYITFEEFLHYDSGTFSVHKDMKQVVGLASAAGSAHYNARCDHTPGEHVFLVLFCFQSGDSLVF